MPTLVLAPAVDHQQGFQEAQSQPSARLKPEMIKKIVN
jgi:hypothetical protein